MLEALSISLNPAAVLGFLLYMLGGAVFLGAFQFIYTRMTPHKEFVLIRENNVAASIALSGAIIDFAIPASNVIAFSVSLLDFLVWALIAGVVQLAGFFVTSLVIKNVGTRIRNGELATGIYVAAVAISIGMLNAACMTPSTY
jgi:putative membrane protein